MKGPTHFFWLYHGHIRTIFLYVVYYFIELWVATTCEVAYCQYLRFFWWYYSYVRATSWPFFFVVFTGLLNWELQQHAKFLTANAVSLIMSWLHHAYIRFIFLCSVYCFIERSIATTCEVSYCQRISFHYVMIMLWLYHDHSSSVVLIVLLLYGFVFIVQFQFFPQLIFLKLCIVCTP